jgi:hypothetical protein
MAILNPPNGGAREPSPQEVVAVLVKEDESKGMAVHSFDPDASPAEKAAAVGKGRDQLKSLKDRGPGDGGPRGESH